MDEDLRRLWETAGVLYGIFIVVIGVLILLSVLVSLCAVKWFLMQQELSQKFRSTPEVPAAAAIGIVATYKGFYKLFSVGYITDTCMSKAASKTSIYSSALQACGGRSMRGEQNRADHRDFLNYIERNPTGVIIGTLIDTPFVCKILISLGTVCVSILSYMVMKVGLEPVMVE